MNILDLFFKKIDIHDISYNNREKYSFEFDEFLKIVFGNNIYNYSSKSI